MAIEYKIKFTKPWLNFKKGNVTTKYSRDNSAMLVNTLKVAQYVTETSAKKKTEKE